ncbi:MAG: GTP cyclohydrolase II [Pseudomonadota bacterium]
MTLAPTPSELLARARSDLRAGVPIVFSGTPSLVAVSAETLDNARLKSLQDLSANTVIAITERRAVTLKARAYDGDLARVRLPENTSESWVRSIADPASDLMNPMRGPLACERGGEAETYRMAIRLAKSARLLPAVVCAPVDDAVEFSFKNNLVCLKTEDIADLLTTRSPLHPVVHANLPIEVSETSRLHVFRPEDGGEEHYAIEVGRPDRSKPVLARLHSACFTGDLIGSLKCDCGPQLRAALSMMGADGSGVLLYMNQEGRGIGLSNKMRAYSLQDQGFDTVEANHRLGFEDDERDFRLAADMLSSLGFSRLRLLTNNPRKVEMMQNSMLTVTERVPLHVGENRHNRAYMATKIAKSGHIE